MASTSAQAWMPCCFHRRGGLDYLYTPRFQTGQPAVEEAAWADDKKHLIFYTVSKVAESLDIPIMVEVRLAVPKDGDNLRRLYVDARGERVEMPSPPYLVSDVDLASRSFDQYVRSFAIAWARKKGSDYQEAARLACDPAASRRTMEVLLWLEFGRLWKTGTAYICGHDKLGIPPVPDDARYMAGKVLLPRIMSPQLDIISSDVLFSFTDQLLGHDGYLTALMDSAEPKDVHTVYVCLRVLTVGNIWMARDRRRHGHQNGLEGPSVPEAIEIADRSLDYLVGEMNRRLLSRGPSCYEKILSRLSLDERLYHEQIDVIPPAGVAEEDNPMYWLPSLRELCTVQRHRRIK